MSNVIRNRWVDTSEDPLEHARILLASEVPEGVDVERVRARAGGTLALDRAQGHVVSMIGGEAHAIVDGEALQLRPGVHLYVPPGVTAPLHLAGGASLVRVSAATARGREVRVRDEAFISACATDGQALRWVLTPQYLSRRIFLHHDSILTSRSGHPLSWFHTTMFDVAGLPPNAEGESVFKMSYNSRTEFNVCHDVHGDARVRMAVHPYADREQRWSAWEALDGETTYHLDEPAGGSHEERQVDATGVTRTQRNKHEVLARGGHVSLFCMFDPAPTGVERHRPGEYSDYEPFAEVSVREEYHRHQREIVRLDAMVDRLSTARARGRLDEERGSEAWAVYQSGRAAQRAAIEAALLDALVAEGRGREAVVSPWRSEVEM